MASEPRIEIALGTVFVQGAETWTVTRKLSLGKVFAEASDGIQGRTFPVAEVASALDPPERSASPSPPARDLAAISEEDWAVAQRRFAFVERLVGKEGRQRRDVEAAAKVAGIHPSTMYEWIAAYEDAGHVSALLPRTPGPKRGSRRLPIELEECIDAEIEALYLHPQRLVAQEVVAAVEQACRKAGLKPPSPGAIRSRISGLDPGMVLRRRGRKDKARDKLQPIRGPFPDQGTPLSDVQIDHTPADIEVVDDERRLPMGKPWITLAICVSTRMISGVYVSMEAPSTAVVGACIANAMLNKRAYLASLDVAGDWPVWGRLGTIHADNAGEFRGEMLQRACLEYRMTLVFRPGRQPQYGGHIERLIGTTMREVHKLPGTTKSNPQMRKGYDSSKNAAMTLREFEAYIVDWIVNKYHRKPHGALKMPPARKWQIGIEGDSRSPGIGIPETFTDEERLRLDFMPFVRRTIQVYGVLIDGIHYWDEVLKDRISLDEKRKHIFRFDPRNMSVIHFFDEATSSYYDIPYRDLSRPALSRWEIRAARKALADEGRKDFDEQAIFETAERLRLRVAESVGRTKAARRDAHRAKVTEGVARKRREGSPAPKPQSGHPTTLPDKSSAQASGLDDLFAKPAERFAKAGSLVLHPSDDEDQP